MCLKSDKEMKVPKLDKFLFYFPLEIGGYAIGGLCLIISISMITLPSIYIANILIIYNSFNESDQDALRNIIISKFCEFFVISWM